SYSRKLLDEHFADQREKIPAFNGTTLHGLRATRVIELRRFGLTTTQIQDQIGMSLAMIERYCRFADKKASGQAAVVALSERRKNRGLQNVVQQCAGKLRKRWRSTKSHSSPILAKCG